jgi:predicted SAM-dependent methyltransferase
VKLHLGCGGVRLEGFLNVDVRPDAKAADEVHDLTKPWPWESGSVDEVHAFHVLEHLTRKEGKHFCQEAARVLKEGGLLVLELPNAKAAAYQYAVEGDDGRADNLWGLQRNEYDFHRWGYYPGSLERLLRPMRFRTRVMEATDYHAQDEPCFRVEAIRE